MDTFREKINSSRYLYYYTTIETLLKILSSMSIKYGKGSNMNDMFESDRTIFFNPNNIDIEEEVRRELVKYEQISFSIDSRNPQGLRGFEIPSMWGHYASKGYGVCLAIEKDKLKDRHLVREKNITYSDKYNGVIDIECKDTTLIVKYIRKRIGDLFFKKSKSWSYEQEYRLISYFEDCEDHFIDIRGALSFILVHLYKEQDIIQRIAGNIPVYKYENFRDERNIIDAQRTELWSSEVFENYNIDL